MKEARRERMKRMMAITMSVIVLLVMISGCSNAGKTDRDKATFKESSGNASGTADAKKQAVFRRFPFRRSFRKYRKIIRHPVSSPGRFWNYITTPMNQKAMTKKQKRLKSVQLSTFPFSIVMRSNTMFFI